MIRKLLAATLCTTCLFVNAGCGSTRRSEPQVATLSLNAEQQHGQILFHKYCDQCHPHGEAGLGPAINVNPAPMAAFRAQVRGGLGAMPAFPDAVIPDHDLDQLLAFVAVQRKDHD
jgi:mono/diheme cytochrome c family protein